MKTVAFFDAKSYDRESFKRFEDEDISIRFFENKLNADTVSMAACCDGVCVFVNDTLDRTVIEKLAEYGVGIIALRCAGYNNVDLKAASGRVRVVRVPAYSPYAVAEHAGGASAYFKPQAAQGVYQNPATITFRWRGLSASICTAKPWEL